MTVDARMFPSDIARAERWTLSRVLVGAIALNGIAAEALFRGFVFGKHLFLLPFVWLLVESSKRRPDGMPRPASRLVGASARESVA